VLGFSFSSESGLSWIVGRNCFFCKPLWQVENSAALSIRGSSIRGLRGGGTGERKRDQEERGILGRKKGEEGKRKNIPNSGPEKEREVKISQGREGKEDEKRKG